MAHVQVAPLAGQPGEMLLNLVLQHWGLLSLSAPLGSSIMPVLVHLSLESQPRADRLTASG